MEQAAVPLSFFSSCFFPLSSSSHSHATNRKYIPARLEELGFLMIKEILYLRTDSYPKNLFRSEISYMCTILREKMFFLQTVFENWTNYFPLIWVYQKPFTEIFRNKNIIFACCIVISKDYIFYSIRKYRIPIDLPNCKLYK